MRPESLRLERLLFDVGHGLLAGEGVLAEGFGEDPDAVEGLAEFGVGSEQGVGGVVVALTCGGGIGCLGFDVKVRGDVETGLAEGVVDAEARKAVLDAVGTFDDKGRIDADALRERGRCCCCGFRLELFEVSAIDEGRGLEEVLRGLVVEPRVPRLLFGGELAGLGPVPEAVVAGSGEAAQRGFSGRLDAFRFGLGGLKRLAECCEDKERGIEDGKRVV